MKSILKIVQKVFLIVVFIQNNNLKAQNVSLFPLGPESYSVSKFQFSVGPKFYTNNEFQEVYQSYKDNRPWLTNADNFSGELMNFRLGIMEDHEKYFIIYSIEYGYHNLSASGVQPFDNKLSTRQIKFRNFEGSMEWNWKFEKLLLKSLGLGVSLNRHKYVLSRVVPEGGFLSYQRSYHNYALGFDAIYILQLIKYKLISLDFQVNYHQSVTKIPVKILAEHLNVLNRVDNSFYPNQLLAFINLNIEL